MEPDKRRCSASTTRFSQHTVTRAGRGDLSATLGAWVAGDTSLLHVILVTSFVLDTISTRHLRQRGYMTYPRSHSKAVRFHSKGLAQSPHVPVTATSRHDRAPVPPGAADTVMPSKSFHVTSSLTSDIKGSKWHEEKPAIVLCVPHDLTCVYTVKWSA